MSENYLIHFGNKNSGRYPRGSGENPHQHDGLRIRINNFKNERHNIKLNKTKNKYNNKINKHINDNNEAYKSRMSDSKSKEFLNNKYGINDGDKHIEDLKGKEKQKAYSAAKSREEWLANKFKDSNKIWNTTLNEINKSNNAKQIKLTYKMARRKVPILRYG